MPEDILDRASAQLEHQRLTSLINSMADGVIALDEKLRIVLYNAAALSVLDINTAVQDIPLRHVLKLYDKDGKSIDIEEIISKIKIPTSSRDYLLHYVDNSTINLYLSIAPVHLGFGQAGERGFVLVLRDITREKSLEEERDEFISVVSHELRTPIAIAEGNISNAQFIASKTGDIAQIEQALTDAHVQVLFLSEMINDLSTLSRAERGHLNVEVAPINAHDLIKGLVNNYQPQAEAKGLEIRTDIDPHLELLHSSELYVREILQNFITNSIKYTEKGHVVIGASPKNNGIEFSVSDTGIGIGRSDQEKVFNKFFRSEDYRTRKTKGTGLGLYITKKLAHLLKAHIEVDSELNKGSTFTIFIPNLG